MIPWGLIGWAVQSQIQVFPSGESPILTPLGLIAMQNGFVETCCGEAAKSTLCLSLRAHAGNGRGKRLTDMQITGAKGEYTSK